jgi:hypothetical protein
MPMISLPQNIGISTFASRTTLGAFDPASKLRRAFSCVLGFFFLAWAAFYSMTTLFAIANFAWRQPMYDQWRTYLTLLRMPFPQNVIQLENGHRPIIPNLIRIAEIRWFAADQILQITVGTASVILTALLLAATIWRQREASLVERSAGVMLVVLGILWLANARMLLHGNELLHAYLLTLALVCALLCTFEAHRRKTFGWFVVATCSCGIAMFCFGPGVASFPAIVLTGIVLRLPSRWHVLPVAVFCGLLLLYVFVLPGDNSVRHMASFRPVDSIIATSRWISSPWINGWLGLADPPLYPWITSSHQSLETALRESASAVLNASGSTWASFSTALGLIGMFAFASRFGWAFIRNEPPSRVETLMLGIGVFAMATAAEIGVMRLDYLEKNPLETYSDRYLVWPSLFWMSLSVLALRDVAQLRRTIPSASIYAFCALLPVMLLTTQAAWAGWGATVYRQAQQLAAAARSNVVPPATLLSDPAANSEMRLSTLRELRSRHLAMFADEGWERVGKPWSGRVEHDDSFVVTAHAVEIVADVDGGIALHFEGYVERGISSLQNSQLAVLDDSGNIAGLAEFSFVARSSLLLSLPQKRGFDGYIKHPDATKTYVVVSLDLPHDRAIALASLPLPSPSPSPAHD